MRTLILLLAAILAACDAPATPATTTPDTPLPALAVAWSTGDQIHLWRTDLAEPHTATLPAAIRTITLAPDGTAAAVTFGPPTAHALAVVTSDTIRTLLPTQDQRLIGQVAWADARTLYINTLRYAAPSARPADDLWRANLDDGTAQRILPPGDGGRFTLNPAGDQIAIVRAGTYGDTSGALLLLDVAADDATPRPLLAFDAISTGTHGGLYPAVHWQDDALLLAIPDPDLIYAPPDGPLPPTHLWRVPLAADEPAIIGSVQASRYGLPRWSADGQRLAFMRGADAVQSVPMTLYVAAGDGSDAYAPLAEPVRGLGAPQWVEQRLFFSQVEGAHFAVALDGAVQTLPGALPMLGHLLPGDVYVYITETASGPQVAITHQAQPPRYLGPASQIATLDAILLPPRRTQRYPPATRRTTSNVT